MVMLLFTSKVYPPFTRARTLGAVLCYSLLPKAPILASYCSLHEKQPKQHNQQSKEQCNNNCGTSMIGSPARVQKLIASQSDALLAKEIFELASRQPNFRHSYAAYHTLILKLGRSRQFSLMQRFLYHLQSEQRAVSPSLFSEIIQLYGDANMPDEALKTFYTMVQFGSKPQPRQLNHLLEVLVAHRNYLRPALDLFNTADRYGVTPRTKSYNILMRAFCLNGDISIAYSLFNQMFRRDVVPDVESYHILMQGLCRKSQVNTAVDLLEDMFNKGFVPDTLSYTTLLNSLCRKKKLKEAYKLLCRMKVKGCNPDIVHYNTVILGFCREGRAVDACKVLDDMCLNGCLPNLVSYRTLVGGLCNQGMFEQANHYMVEMISKRFSPHFSVVHALVKGFCNVGKTEEACSLLSQVLRHGEAPHFETWAVIIPRIFVVDDVERIEKFVREVLKVCIEQDTKIVEAGVGLEDYVIKKIQARSIMV